MKVMKFGGTSVGKPERMFQVAELVTRGDEPDCCLSALSGTLMHGDHGGYIQRVKGLWQNKRSQIGSTLPGFCFKAGKKAGIS
jgi:hypothetical protein